MNIHEWAKEARENIHDLMMYAGMRVESRVILKAEHLLSTYPEGESVGKKETNNKCCMVCSDWRYMERGIGECRQKHGNVPEGFYCSDFCAAELDKEGK